MGAAGALLHGFARLAVWAADWLWPRLRSLAHRAGGGARLERLRGWLGRLPAGVALPLFLVPEACSRLGWAVSAWILLHGQPWRALAVYAATKLIAGSLALWIYLACLPALLRIRAFAAAHAWMVAWRQRAATWASRHGNGRLRAAMAEVRERRR